MRAILDRQHLGKPSKPGDHGAVHGALRETDLTEGYIAAAAETLRAAGVEVLVLTEGEYADRHRQAIAWARTLAERCAYVACHVNAGGGRYALAEYDGRSKAGAKLAAALSDACASLPGISAGKVVPLAAGERGWICIDGIYAGPGQLSGAIFEPGFIDAPAHAALWTSEGLRLVGQTLAAGVLAWGERVA